MRVGWFDIWFNVGFRDVFIKLRASWLCYLIVMFSVAMGVLTFVPVSFSQSQTGYSTTRTSSFEYRADGLPQREVIEPEQAQQCLSTSYTYDGHDNREIATVTNCTGATVLTQIASRSSRSTYAAGSDHNGNPTGSPLPVPAGAFATSALNALKHGETRAYFPRFGAVVRLTGSNSLNTDWAMDSFGRKTFERRADGTGTTIYHCWLSVSFNGVAISTTSSAAGCHN